MDILDELSARHTRPDADVMRDAMQCIAALREQVRRRGHLLCLVYNDMEIELPPDLSATIGKEIMFPSPIAKTPNDGLSGGEPKAKPSRLNP